MFRPFHATAGMLGAVALISSACATPSEPTYEAKAAALAEIAEAHQSAREGASTMGPQPRALDEMGPLVRWDAPDATPVDEAGRGRPEWKQADSQKSEFFVLGRVVDVQRGMNFTWLPEDAPRDPKWGDGVPRPCTVADKSCTTIHLTVDIERAFPEIEEDQIEVGVVARGPDFQTYAEGMFALGRAVFVVQENWRMFAYDQLNG